MLGKWQLGSKPSEHGFDVVVDHRDLEGYRHHLGPGGAHLTDTLTDRTIEFIEERRDGPWAVYLSHYAVHSPLQPRPDLLSIYQSKKQGSLHRNPELAAMIHGVDEGVGRIVAALEDLGEREDTIIFFTSDNGGWGDVTDMDPLRGYKGTFYEGGIRVPFIVSWPGHVEAGRTTTEPTIGVDLSPTLLELAGAETPNQPMDGVSLVPLLRGERDRLGPRAIYWHFPLYLQSLEVDDEQRDPLFRTRPCSIVRQGDYKLHQYFEDGALELYNLMRDPGELTNLADSEPKLRDELLGVLNQWRSDLDAFVPRETNPEFDEAAEKSARAQARNSKGL